MLMMLIPLRKLVLLAWLVGPSLVGPALVGPAIFGTMLFSSILIGLGPLQLAAQDQPKTAAYFAEIWTGQGDVIRSGAMVVEDGRIAAIGERSEIQVPPGAVVHDLGRQVIIPGLVVAHTGLTTGGSTEYALTPEIAAIDGFDFFADRSELLEAGITSFQISPGSSRLIAGVDAVVKLTGQGSGQESASELRAAGDLQLVLDSRSRSPSTVYEPPVGPVSIERPLTAAQPQLSRTLGTAMAGLRLIFENASSDREFVTADADPVGERVGLALQNSSQVRVAATSPAEIRGALELARENDLQLLLADASDLEPFADSLHDWQGVVRGVILPGRKPGVISNPSVSEIENEVAPWASVNRLIEAGIPVAVRAASDADLTSIRFAAGQFIQGDVTPQQVLSMVTQWPAQMLGVGDRVGSLAVGNDADFVVLNGAPFQLKSKVLATYVNGRRAFERQPRPQTMVVRASQVWSGQGDLADATEIVVSGSTIRSIGRDVSAPLDALEFDFENAVIVPGFIDLGTGLGTGGNLTGNIALDTELSEQLDRDDPAVRIARSGGITTALVGSLNASKPTPLIAVKLDDGIRVIADPAAIRFSFGDETAASVEAIKKQLASGKAYVDSWSKYQRELAEYKTALAEYEQKKAELEKKKAQDKESADKESADKDSKESGDKDQGTGESGESDEDDSEDGEQSGGQREGEVEAGSGSNQSGRNRRGRRGRAGGQREQTENRDSDSRQQPGDQDESDDDADSPEEDGEQKETGQTDQDDEAEEADEADEAEDGLEKPTEPKKPRENKKLEPYKLLFDKQIPAIVAARKSTEIEAALELFRGEYDIRTIISGADDLGRFPDLLADEEVSVIAGPELVVNLERTNQPDRTVNLAQVLANQGVPFGMYTGGTTGARQLPSVVQFAISQGLGVGDALNALTAAPAEMLNPDFTLGTLREGHDADLVVLSGPPFEFSTRVLAVMIDGQWVYQLEENQ